MESKDYYRILGVDPSADVAVIRRAYRELAFQYHPDRNRQNPSAAERMKAVNEAYAVLADPAKRREYDALRRDYGSAAHGRFRQSYSQEDIFRNSDIHQVFEEMARSFGFRGFEDIFRECYGRGFKTFHGGRHGFHVRGFFFGGCFGPGMPGQRRSLPRGAPLPKLAQFFLDRLTAGRLPRDGKNMHDTITLDEKTARSGGPYAYYDRRQSKKLIVRVPPGVKNGGKIRLKGLGEAGRAGGSPGDLYLTVRIRRPLIERIKGYIKSR